MFNCPPGVVARVLLVEELYKELPLFIDTPVPGGVRLLPCKDVKSASCSGASTRTGSGGAVHLDRMPPAPIGMMAWALQ